MCFPISFSCKFSSEREDNPNPEQNIPLQSLSNQDSSSTSGEVVTTQSRGSELHTRRVSHALNVQLNIGAEDSSDSAQNILETANKAGVLITKFLENERVSKGMQHCQDTLRPCCTAAPGCPSCGCSNGACGCGSFGKFLCSCFDICCLNGDGSGNNDNAPLSQAEKFQQLINKYGPIALQLAVEETGINLLLILEEEKRYPTEDEWTKLSAAAKEAQTKLSRAGDLGQNMLLFETYKEIVLNPDPDVILTIRRALKIWSKDRRYGFDKELSCSLLSTFNGRDFLSPLDLPALALSLAKAPVHLINPNEGFAGGENTSSTLGIRDAGTILSLLKIVLLMIFKTSDSRLVSRLGGKFLIPVKTYEQLVCYLLLALGYLPSFGSREEARYLLEDPKLLDLKNRLIPSHSLFTDLAFSGPSTPTALLRKEDSIDGDIEGGPDYAAESSSDDDSSETESTLANPELQLKLIRQVLSTSQLATTILGEASSSREKSLKRHSDTSDKS